MEIEKVQCKYLPYTKLGNENRILLSKIYNKDLITHCYTIKLNTIFFFFYSHNNSNFVNPINFSKC